MLALFRSDALPYLHYLAISRQASSDITHMSQSGVANVIRWAQQHPQELGTLTPDRSFALAQQLYQPLRPLTFEALEGDRHSGKDRISRRFMSLAGEALGKIDLLKPLAESIYPAELAAIDYNDPSVQIDALAKMAKQIGSSELNSETQDVFHTLKPPPDKKPNITP